MLNLAPGDSLFITFFMVYVAICILNYGIMFAFLQRVHLDLCTNKEIVIKQIITSLFISLFGPLATFQILLACEWGKRGWKLYIGEPLLASRSLYWTERLIEYKRKSKLRSYRRSGSIIICDAGAYISIWAGWPA